MNKRRGSRLMAEINITPFTDVILVLLIIFMVATPLVFRSGIKIQLPKAASKEDVPGTVFITVDKGGGIYLEPLKERYVFPKDQEKFWMALMKRFLESTSAAVVINGDKDSRYETVITVLDLSKRVGYTKVFLSTEIKKQDF
jgi:biopolymer transport protein ExbD